MINSAQLKNQKGSAVLIIVIVVCVLVVLGVMAVLFTIGLTAYKSAQKEAQSSVNSNQTSTDPTQALIDRDLDKVETDKFIFYYPKGYTSETRKGYQYNYANENTKAVSPEHISLAFTEVDNSNKKAPTFEGCNKFAQTLRSSSDEEIKVELVSYEKFYGCKITVDAPVGEKINDSVIDIRQIVYSKDPNDNIIYNVGAIYFSNASSDQSQVLNAAIDLFEIK